MSVILITGSSTGIGMAAALYLSKKGHRVYASMRNPAVSSELRSAAAAAGSQVEVIALDVSDEQSVKKAVAQVLEREGRIDVLVNNAGIAPIGPLEEVDDAEVKRVFDTNVFGLLRCVRAVLPSMRKQKSGSIINIGSVAGDIASTCSGVYAASKFALEGLSESLAQEVKPFGIHVALIKPGFILTPIIGKALEALPKPESSAYPTAVRVANALFQSATTTGGPPEMVAMTIEEAMNDRTSRLRYPVGVPARAILAARAAMSDEEWVDLGRHETFEAYFGELASHIPQPPKAAAEGGH
jgi:NAD(P)-dependent dehydrogenase (short-subunit alcohol dehydrogenase family)